MRALHVGTRLSKKPLCGADGEIAATADLATCRSCKRLTIWPSYAWRAACTIVEKLIAAGLPASAYRDGGSIPVVEIGEEILLVLDASKKYTTDLGEWLGVEHYIAGKRRLRNSPK